jgi:DNA-binding NtrC family response regulator
LPGKVYPTGLSVKNSGAVFLKTNFMRTLILVVDDEADIRALLQIILTKAGFDVLEAADGAELSAALNGPQPDLTLLDLQLPDSDGLTLLPQIKKAWPDTEVVMLTGHGSLDTAVQAIKLGAYDFQQKPFDPKTLLVSLERALEHKKLKEEASSLRKALTHMTSGASPTFRSAIMKVLLRKVEKVAPTDVSVLITGESGTGKEVIADMIHTLSPRNQGPLVKINCAALPHDQIEAELFGSIVKDEDGHEQTDREGLFRKAAGGTLVLDQITEMPVDTQSKLLRVLQEKHVIPVGGETPYQTDCRIISITNRDAQSAISVGKLREDLFYRVNEFSVEIPPLRNRREDVLALADEFLKRYSAQANNPLKGFTDSAQNRLRSFDWPGNVRQLQNVIQQAVLMCDSNQLTEGDLIISDESTPEEAFSEKLTLMQGVVRNTIIQMLKETGGNKLEAAKRLGIGRQTLYNKIKSYQIEA